MASDEEDEELAALRFAALASMKSKQKPVEEDEDLKALKEAALRSLEKTVVCSSTYGGSHISQHPTTLSHLHSTQSQSPSYYSSSPPVTTQYSTIPYSQPPPHYQHSQSGLQSRSSYQQHQRNHLRGRLNSSRGRSNTPPNVARKTTGRGGVSRGGSSRGLPPRANNLIVISPMPPEGAITPNSQAMGHRSDRGSKGDMSSTKPVLLRPQDKWYSGTSDNSQTDSPSRPKASSKFSRFDTSSGSEEESESEEEVPVNRSSDRGDNSSLEGSDAEDKLLGVTSGEEGSGREAGSQGDKSGGSERSDSDSDHKSDSEKESEVSSSESESESDPQLDGDKCQITLGSSGKMESETEEEKLQRKEADRLLEETMDHRRVLNINSEKEEGVSSKWTKENIKMNVPTEKLPSFDLSQKLLHHRARVKEQSESENSISDLSFKLTSRKIRNESDQNISAPVLEAPKDFVNITINKKVEKVSEAQMLQMSENDLRKFEARKRKFQSSPVSSSKEGRKTISLKGIVPRSKKRQKEIHRSRSTSPIPKRYSRDLERYEKKKASKERHKSGSKENKEQKVHREIKDVKSRIKERVDKKINDKREENEGSSEESQSEVCAQISDSDSDNEGRSWKKEENKDRLHVSKGRTRVIRDTLDSVQLSSRARRPYDVSSSLRDRYSERKGRFDRSRDSRKEFRMGQRRPRHRSIEVMRESESDSDGPKLPSSIVLPSSRQQCKTLSDRQSKQEESEEEEEEDSHSSQDSSPSCPLRISSATQKRTVLSVDSGRSKQSRGSRKVTTDHDSGSMLSLRTKSSHSQENTRRNAKFESRDRSPLLSVTLDADKHRPEIDPSKSRNSVHERLGRQLNSDLERDNSTLKHSNRRRKENSQAVEHSSSKRAQDESSKPDDDLEQRIQRIKEKNAAILKRREEVQQDKERYG